MTVYFSTKPKSAEAVDASNLHQIGIAAALYAEENDERYPLTVEPLLLLKRVPGAILSSPNDKTPNGIRNLLAYGSEIPDKIRGVKITYVGPGEGGAYWEFFRDRIMPGRNPGWLVNLSRCEVDSPPDYHGATGLYQRLLMDGAVITRRSSYQVVHLKSGKEEKVISFLGFFNDEDAQWFEDRGP